MYKKMLSGAMYAGLSAGLIAALLQFTFVIPVLLEGELYESGQRIHFATDGTPMSDRGAPSLGWDWSRHLMTVAFNLVTYWGFALLLAAVIGFTELRGLVKITPRQGIIWGLSGFFVIQFAPAFGLPPELPGTIAAELAPRQIWWIATILASGVGIWLIAFGRKFLPFVGAALLAIPHLVGAPHLDKFWGIAPPELSAEFATLSLGAAAPAWCVLGLVLAWVWTRED